MTDLVQKLSGVRDLKRILETTVKELGESFGAESCQIMLSNPLDVNSTNICEYKLPGDEEEDLTGVPSVTLPLMLHGRTLGAFSISRRREVGTHEVNAIRGILGELSDIVRHAQINDVVQRDTFRDTFLVEIGNLMSYSLGIGDALFMVVNILGKVLQSSRCLFICTDDNQAGWKCFEFWKQEQVQSCQDYLWPTTDSPVVAQTLLSSVPLQFYEGQQNSYVSPVQEELQFIGVKSLLGIALRSSQGTHGCVILQQCDYRRAWTRGEIDMVQNVADKVADALVKLPAEKRAREPIMQLHQRIVAPAQDAPEGDPYSKIDNVRKALKGALGQQVIPSSRHAPAKPKPPAPAKPLAPPQAPAAAAQAPAAAAQASQVPSAAPATGPVTPVAPAPVLAPAAVPPAPVVTSESPSVSQPTISPVPAKWAGPAAALEQAPAPSPQMPAAPVTQQPAAAPSSFAGPPTTTTPAANIAALGATASGAAIPEVDPYSNLEFGDYTDFTDPPPEPVVKRARPGRAPREDADATWDKLKHVDAPTSETLTPSSEVVPAASAINPVPAASAPDATPVPPAQTGFSLADLDAIGRSSSAPAAPVSVPTPVVEALAAPVESASADVSAAGPWGNLDSIAAPTGTPARGGLGGKMIGKARASSTSGLFNKKKGMMGGADAAPGESTESAPASAAPEAKPQLDDAEATLKLKAIMDTKNERSDYVFATPGLDMRVLGRIDGWLSEIEAKDAFVNGHAMQTAKYAVAIAEQARLPKEQVDLIRQAALVHDVGKLGAPASLLQKSDENLDDSELLTVMGLPMAGAELLDSFPDLKPLVLIVRGRTEKNSMERGILKVSKVTKFQSRRAS